MQCNTTFTAKNGETYHFPIQKLETGVYETDFNFHLHIGNVKGDYYSIHMPDEDKDSYGVADNYQQVLQA